MEIPGKILYDAVKALVSLGQDTLYFEVLPPGLRLSVEDSHRPALGTVAVPVLHDEPPASWRVPWAPVLAWAGAASAGAARLHRDGEALVLSTWGFESRIPPVVLDSQACPRLRPEKDLTWIPLDSTTFTQMTQAVQWAAGDERVRPELSTVQYEIRDGWLSSQAMGQPCMARATREISWAFEAPIRWVLDKTEAQRIAAQDFKSLALEPTAQNPTGLRLKSGSSAFRFPLVQTTMPDTESMWGPMRDKALLSQVDVLALPLRNGLKRLAEAMGKASDSAFPIVTLEDGQLVLSVQGNWKAQVRVPLHQTGVLALGGEYNSRMLLDASQGMLDDRPIHLHSEGHHLAMANSTGTQGRFAVFTSRVS